MQNGSETDWAGYSQAHSLSCSHFLSLFLPVPLPSHLSHTSLFYSDLKTLTPRIQYASISALSGKQEKLIILGTAFIKSIVHRIF